MHDYRFRPQAVRAEPGKLRVDAREPTAASPHNFRLERSGRPLAEVTALKPGEQETHDLRAAARASYKMFCSIANHEELGMYGTLTVGAP